MITFIVIFAIAIIFLFGNIMMSIRQLRDEYDEMLNDLAMCKSEVSAVVKEVNIHTGNIADLNGFVSNVEKKKAGNKRYIELDERRSNYKELRETFNHDIKESAQAMKISMKTAKRYEKWRLENSNL